MVEFVVGVCCYPECEFFEICFGYEEKREQRSYLVPRGI